jgi:arginyl-tRNA--protein-N-Asp/Glu arginylyltransferase
METVFQFVAPPSPCGYLPGECWQLEYEIVGKLTADEYMDRLEHGWRRFGASLFRPRCPACSKCQSIRVVVDRFAPDRRMRRTRKTNAGQVRLHIGTPAVTREKLRLYDRFHAFQSDFKGWPEHDAKDADSYSHSFVENPFATEEWCYYLDDELVGVGYVDALPRGLSAIYFFYEPEHRDRSLGTWNVMALLEEAAARGLPHLYLGYYVEGCRSMAYKGTFRPNQVLGVGGGWRDFRE